MIERIKELRKKLNLTQSAFASELGISSGGVQCWEYGKNLPSNAMIELICKKFNVSRDWLVNGEGDMFVPQEPNATIEAITAYYHESDTFKVILDAYVRLDSVHGKMFEDFVESISEGLQGDSARLRGIGKEIEADIDQEEKEEGAR